MSDGINKVMLGGSLGADPELRYTQSGSPVLNMRVATNESWIDKDKVRQERTEWHSVVVFGPRGEALAKILTKGMFVFIDGSLRTDSYEKDGVTRYKTEVIARDVVLPPRAKRDGDHAEHDAAPTAPRSAAQPDRTGGQAQRPTQGARAGGVTYPGVRSAGDFEVRFGSDAGKHISMVENLDSLRAFIIKGIEDPKRAQYADRGKAQVNAIDELLAQRARGGAAPVEDDGGGYGGMGDDDGIPF